MQLTHFVERMTRKFGEKKLADILFFGVSKAFGTIGIVGLLYLLTLLNFPPYKVLTIYPITGVERSEVPSRRSRHLVETNGLVRIRKG